jgi:glycerol-3-phosphate acyltransferase PlsY
MKGIEVLAWILFAFLCGSLTFSVWIGRYILKVDIRQFGDKNLGTANNFRAGGRIWGAMALVLDFLVVLFGMPGFLYSCSWLKCRYPSLSLG